MGTTYFHHQRGEEKDANELKAQQNRAGRYASVGDKASEILRASYKTSEHYAHRTDYLLGDWVDDVLRGKLVGLFLFIVTTS